MIRLLLDDDDAIGVYVYALQTRWMGNNAIEHSIHARMIRHVNV